MHSNHKKGVVPRDLITYTLNFSHLSLGVHIRWFENTWIITNIFLKWKAKAGSFQKTICISVHQKYVLIVDIVFYGRFLEILMKFWKVSTFLYLNLLCICSSPVNTSLYLQLRTSTWAIFND